MSKQKLGRGLQSLIPQLTADKIVSTDKIVSIQISKIKPNKEQPRTFFDEEKLNELAESIKQNGLIEPVIVVPSLAPGEYELIAGERRLRASKIAGFDSIKAVVKDQISDRDKLDIALIENIQREDLNPIEEAKAYKRYAEEYSYTQEQIAKTVNKNRSVIANSLRLLTLSEDIQKMIEDGRISAGHGKMLAGIADEEQRNELVKQILENKLTVRGLEQKAAETKKANDKKPKIQDIEITNLVDDLQRVFGTKIAITGNGKKGKIILNYSNLDDLERISNLLKR